MGNDTEEAEESKSPDGAGGRPSAQAAPVSTAGKVRRSRRARGVPHDNAHDDSSTSAERRRFPWGWLLLVTALMAMVALVAMDLAHRDRYELVCTGEQIQFKRGRRFPQPFGFETVGGPFRPVRVLPGTACPRQQAFDSLAAAEAAYLEFVLSQVRQALTEPTDGHYRDMRQQLRQALQITRSKPHRSRHKRAQSLMADLDYREGRAALARVEVDLRMALVRLRETYRLAPGRYPDLRQWIQHLEALLRSTSPSPGGPQQSDTVLPPRLPEALPPPPPSSEPDETPAEGEQMGSGVLM